MNLPLATLLARLVLPTPGCPTRTHLKRWMAGDGVRRKDGDGDDQDDALRSSMLRLAFGGACCLGSERFSSAIRRGKKV